MTSTDITAPTAVRALCEYEMYGDLTAEAWAGVVLNGARERGVILDYEFHAGIEGPWGIVLVLFSIDLPREGSAVIPNHSSAEARDAVTTLVNEIVGDSDAQCRWITPIA